MQDKSPRKLITGLLVLAFVFFALGQGVEVFHALEEERHLPHHEHVGTVFHEPLPCDSGEHHAHFCLHTQQFSTALQYWQDFTSRTLERPSLANLGCVTSIGFTLPTVRAPPPLS